MNETKTNEEKSEIKPRHREMAIAACKMPWAGTMAHCSARTDGYAQAIADTEARIVATLRKEAARQGGASEWVPPGCCSLNDHAERTLEDFADTLEEGGS